MSKIDEQDECPGLLPRYTLKNANTFLLADALGDIQGNADGLFSNDTRVLSRFQLAVADHSPSLLGGAISQDSTLFTAHLTNRPLPALGERSIPHGVIHIERSRLLWASQMYERLRLTNFSDHAAQIPLKLVFEADFADVFEVQGHRRAQRGLHLTACVSADRVRLSYRGRDKVVRTTEIRFSRIPTSISTGEATFLLELQSRERAELFIEIGADGSETPSAERYEEARQGSSASMHARMHQGATVGTSMRLFNQWVDKSRSDLALLTTQLPTGPYPYAGIPWFATTFGRDAIITSLQMLWINPQLAAGVLRFLASTQAQDESAFQDSQPGKIMHEMRHGEMAALREVPFGQYYGGVDTTPLYVMLAGAYERNTGDRALADEIWNSLLAATNWIEQRLDHSATGFLDYARGKESGLVNQAWKDSHDSIFHADGRLPRGPIAVVEVQAYAYAALVAMAELAARRDDLKRSQAWLARAEQLRAAIEQRFWIPDMNFYALAIDGEEEACRVHASNAGHLLFCGVPGNEHAAAVTAELLSNRFASGWGIRTLAEGEVRYNPMSYHNGSVWPHDTSICAAGISRYGGGPHMLKILSDIFEAANHFEMRLPELFCGFRRIPGHGPVPYPVACLPQAWSSGSIFMLLQSILGIRIDGWRREIHIERPLLPHGIESLTLRDLPVNDTSVDLEFHRIGTEVVVVPARHLAGGVRVLAHL